MSKNTNRCERCGETLSFTMEMNDEGKMVRIPETCLCCNLSDEELKARVYTYCDHCDARVLESELGFENDQLAFCKKCAPVVSKHLILIDIDDLYNTDDSIDEDDWME